MKNRICLSFLSFFTALTGVMLLSSCSSIGTTVSPAMNLSNYNRVYIDEGDNTEFLSMAIYKVFKNSGLEYINSSEYSKNHTPHDFYVIVKVEVGFLFPPSLTRHFELIFTQAKKATVEIQDGVTKKQLLLCTYRRWFGNIGSFDYCREDVVEELTIVLAELKAKGKSAVDKAK